MTWAQKCEAVEYCISTNELHIYLQQGRSVFILVFWLVCILAELLGNLWTYEWSSELLKLGVFRCGCSTSQAAITHWCSLGFVLYECCLVMNEAVKCWSLVCLDAGVLQAKLLSHTDAIWGLSAHSTMPHILSCSADGTVKLWAPHSSKSLLNNFVLDNSKCYKLLLWLVSTANETRQFCLVSNCVHTTDKTVLSSLQLCSHHRQDKNTDKTVLSCLDPVSNL